MSNESGLGLQYPLLITGGDGSTLWAGIGIVSDVCRVTNTDTVAISPGQAVMWDQSATIVQAPDQAASVAPVKQVAAGKLAITTATAIFAGVALTKAAVGEIVVLAAGGSVVPVKSTATGTATYNCIASTTAGSVLPQLALATAPGSTLGHVVKIAGTTGGTTDSGSASYVVVAVNIS